MQHEKHASFSVFIKQPPKFFVCLRKKNLSQDTTSFYSFGRMPALSMQEVRKNCQRNKFKSADALLRKMPGAVLRSGRPAGPAGSDPAAFRLGSFPGRTCFWRGTGQCPAQRRRTPDRFQLVALSVCAPPLRSRFSGSQNLHITL